MIRTSIKIGLFLSAYSPLFIIIILKSLENGILLFSLVISLVITNAIWLVVINLAGKKNIKTIKVKSLENKTGESLSYIIGYVISLADYNLYQTQDIIIVLMLILVLYTIYSNSDMIFINPLMNILGYRMFEVTTENNEKIKIIIRQKFRDHAKLDIQDLSDEFYLAKRRENSMI